MKKFALLSLAAGLAFAGCSKDDDNTDAGSGAYVTDGLVVEERQMVLVTENTGAWCQYCPAGAEIMHAISTAYDYALPIAVHNNDPLATPFAVKMEGEFAAGGYPTIHVMNTALENYTTAFGEVMAAAMLEPEFGVAHKVSSNDTAYVVDVKIKVFKDILSGSSPDLFVQSYLVMDGVLAKDYGGGIDLRQVSSLPIVNTGATVSTWATDAALVDGVPTITAGTPFRHEHNIVAEATADSALTAWGRPLAEINPFVDEYIEGDILGSKYTPIRFYLPKDNGLLDQYDYEGWSVLTVIWRTQTDGEPGEVEFVNGYMSHIE